MPNWDFPFTVTIQYYNTPADATWQVNQLPTPSSTASLDCDVQPKTPGSILQDFGIEANGGCVVFAPVSEKAKILVGSTFVYENQTFVFVSIAGSRVENGPVDHVKAVAVALGG